LHEKPKNPPPAVVELANTWRVALLWEASCLILIVMSLAITIPTG
jgi:hypothetical protein